VDGRGYPAGLRGSEIPAAARIVGAVDAYAAMTQTRPYRASLSPDDAIAELRRNADAQFDAEVVAALVWLLDSGGEDYRMARTRQFTIEDQHNELAERTGAERMQVA
jgi:HD-GYP domain-containing protein (c-di-GMP phosphodiesterase class II)